MPVFKENIERGCKVMFDRVFLSKQASKQASVAVLYPFCNTNTILTDIGSGIVGSKLPAIRIFS